MTNDAELESLRAAEAEAWQRLEDARRQAAALRDDAARLERAAADHYAATTAEYWAAIGPRKDHR